LDDFNALWPLRRIAGRDGPTKGWAVYDGRGKLRSTFARREIAASELEDYARRRGAHMG
jgi:hypothetical protein